MFSFSLASNRFAPFNASSGLPASFAALFFPLISPFSYAQDTPNEDVERYTVTAARPYYDETLSRIFTQYEFDKSHLVTPLHSNDLLLQSPSVSLNGQGGQIQSINIRGYSRWRIQTLLDGVPIVSDRRAGSSIGFIPPDFISTASVLPGAASTYLGSGAIGGAVNMHLAETPTPYLSVGYSSNQQMKALSYAGTTSRLDNNGSLSEESVTDWSISYRNANNGNDAAGNPLYDQFEQTGLFVRHRPEEGVIKEVWTLYSDNANIGKSSSDFPDKRVTTYPNDTHWLGKVTFAHNLFAGDVWWHQSSLDTSVLRPESRINESKNKAFDYGFNVTTDTQWQNWDLNWQIQVSGREGVVADEREFTLNPTIGIMPDSIPESLPSQSVSPELAYEVRTLDASELNTAVVIDISRQWQRLSLALGTRGDWQRQSDNATVKNIQSNTNLSGYAGANYLLSPHWSASVYVSSAFRNPSLTERFFAGETPRGTVLGSAKLKTEQALNTQVSLNYSGEELQGSIEIFHQQIDNYIERTTVAEDVLQYANLDSATIEGVSYQLRWHSDTHPLDARLSGMWIKGEDNLGNTIADIPANNQRLDIGVNWQATRFFTVIAYRAGKTDIADGERSLHEVFTLDIGAEWQMNERIQLQASWSNLTNQHYYSSADDKAAFAQGESVQLALTYLL